ncbi:penicillin-binding protein 2 [Persephonella sp.]
MKINRFNLTVIIFIVLFLILSGRLVYLQIYKGTYYRELSEKNHLRLITLNPPRGKIYDRNGILLAYDEPSYNLYGFPYILKEKIDQIKKDLKEKLNIELSEKTLKKLKTGSTRKIIIKKDLTENQIKLFFNYSYLFNGLFIEVQPKRIYTEYAKYMPHLLGYVGYPSEKDLRANPSLSPDMLIGKQGVEKIYDQYLRGKYGVKAVVVDALGRIKNILWEVQPKRGNDIYLTIDARIQKIAYEAFKKSRQKSGAIIITDPYTYEILTLLSYPVYDIQKFSDGLTKKEWNKLIKNKYKPLFNKALSGIYPPGSIFKIIVGIAALEEGVVSPYQKIYSGGSFEIGNWVYRNWDPAGCGNIDVREALEMSCDTYFYQIGLDLGASKISYYANLFGLGEKLNPKIEKRKSRIPIPEWKTEVIGEPWFLGDTVNYSIGQGFLAITPFDGIKIIAPIANGGKVLKPKLLKSYYDMDLQELIETKPEVIRILDIKKDYINVIKKGLYLVVYGQKGTAKKLADLPVKNAGKTGTAQVFRKPEKDKKIDRWDLQNHAWYVAFFPYRKPQYVMSVFVEHGMGGSKTAVPITKTIIERLMKEGLINGKR